MVFSLARSVILSAAVTVVVASLVGCAPSEPTAGGGGDCTSPEAACSLNDVDPATLTRMIDLGDEAYEYSQRDGVTWGDVGAFLDEQEDVVRVSVTPVAITFQVEGAPPSYLLSEMSGPAGEPDPSAAESSWPGSPEPEPTEPDPSDSETPDWFPEDLDRRDEVAGASFSAAPSSTGPIVRTAAWTPSSAGASVQTAALPALHQEPVGEPGRGHDRTPTKRALILEPYGPLGVRAVPQDLLGELGNQDQYTVDYYGDVSAYEDSAQVFSALKSLASYDVVYISTHGSSTGFAISPARDWYVKNPDNDRYYLPEGRVLPPGVALSLDDHGVQRFFVTNEFFEHHYQDGLSDTLFYADWCQSAMGMAMRSTIQGAGSVYVGWDQSVDLNLAARAARYFWEGAVDWRVDSTAAYDNVVEHGAHFQPERQIISHGIDCLGTGEGRGEAFDCPELFTATLRVYTSENPLHVLDTVTSSSNDKRIRKGTSLGWTGDAGDGVKDTLDEIQLEVVGLVPGQAADAGHVEITIDGEKIEEKFPVADMAVTDTDGTHWEDRAVTLEDLELPFDITPEQLLRELAWEVRLVGANDAISLHAVDGVRLMGPKLTVVDPELSYDLDDADDLAADDEENDGEPGRTTIALHVEDVGPDVASDYRVEVELTGGTLQGTRELEWSLDEFRPLGENQWRLDQLIDLDFDLTGENRPFRVAARLLQVSDGLLVGEHAPTVLLRGTTPNYCSAQLTLTGEVELGGKIVPINLSDSPYPVWWDIFPGESLVFEPTEKYKDIVYTTQSYTFDADIDGIAAGATGSFTRPAEVFWNYNPPSIHDTSGTLAAFGDVTITITEHRTMIEYGTDEPRTDAVKGTVTGHLKNDAGPDSPGFIDVHATFAISEAGCYPNR
ncbi:MAG: hypothetical protein GX593_01100 [Actinomycetales bacterium]|nr:hypothetical protein [Actinomycetales bacterium]